MQPSPNTGQAVGQQPSQQAYPGQGTVQAPQPPRDVNTYRQEAQRQGVRVDEGDANLFSSPHYQNYLQTGVFGAMPQAAAQQQAARPSFQAYTPATLQGFSAPQESGVVDAQRAMIQRVLTNPETLSPDALAAMREQGKERALAYESQAKEALARDTLNRGTYDGGFRLAGDRRLAGDTIAALVENDRNLALAKAAQDRADQLSAAQLAEGFLSGQFGRATGEFDRNAQVALNNERLKLDATNQANAIQQYLTSLDEDRRRFDYGMGFNYAQLEAQQQQALIAQLLNGLI